MNLALNENWAWEKITHTLAHIPEQNVQICFFFAYIPNGIINGIDEVQYIESQVVGK